MLLSSVTAINGAGAELSLPLEDDGSGFSVKGIDGLDPVAATLVSSSYADQDGEQYQTSRRVTRNIKLSLGLDPDYGVTDVATLRKALYGFFLPKSKLTLKFTTYDKFTSVPSDQYKDYYIDGVVETFDSPLFTSDPAADISIINHDPDLHDLTSSVFDGLTTNGISDETLRYDGTVDTGLLVAVQPTVAVGGFTIQITTPEGVQQLELDYALAPGDLVQINTNPGSKSALLTPSGGSPVSILYAVTPTSAWLRLQPGDNVIRFLMSAAPTEYEITYLNKYGGL